MPVKTSRDDVRDNQGNALVFYGYEGILYAVDNGADIVNCSWGGYGYSRAAEDVIDYALQNGVLIVAAAGNSNTTETFYPAGYKGVLSVAATDQADEKVSFSNYGSYVDVSAPGIYIRSTWQNDSYNTISGTSMASPLVAGLAALVKTQFPDYTPMQLGEQIRVTSDNIDSDNPNYEKMLGFGRVNAANAVSTEDAKSVRGYNFTFEEEGNPNNIFEPGETILISGNFTNYLNPTSNLSITIESKNQYAEVVNSSHNPGALATLEEFDNNSNKFSVSLSEDIPYNSEVKLLINYSDGNYSDYQWISFLANPSYNTVDGNDISLTVASDGALAFNDYPGNMQGEGFKFKDGPNLLFEGAFMYGTDESHLMDAARNNSGENQDNDFNVLNPFVLNVPGEVADYQGNAEFNDDNGGSGSLGITTRLNTYQYVEEPNHQYIILEYVLANWSDEAVNDLYSGLFFDWDIDGQDYSDNKVEVDGENDFVYAYNSDFSPVETYAAASLITSENYSVYAIDNDGSNGSISIYDGFSNTEKYNMISGNATRNSAGPNDISFVVGGGPFNIPANDYITVAFALAASNNYNQLISAIEQSRVKYSEIVTDISEDTGVQPESYSLSQNYPNPFNPSTNIKFTLPERSNVSLKVYDMLGREITTLIDEVKAKGSYKISFNPSAGSLNLSSGVYFYKIKAGKFSSIKKMIYLR
jgi:hypothetical protein